VKTIWKYKLDIGGSLLRIPAGGRILSIQTQRDDIMMWIEVDPNSGYEHEYRSFSIYGTGWEMLHNPGTYLGTVQQLDGEFVWHVYEDAR
jgi:hypothetical protein